MFSNAHEVTAETKENRTIYTQVFEIDNGIEKRCINHWHTLCNLPASDNAVYICGWQDITETRDLINALEVEKNKAIKATVAKSQFLATMSHEIRTPISSIMGFPNFCRVLVLARSNGWRRFHLPTPPDNHSSA